MEITGGVAQFKLSCLVWVLRVRLFDLSHELNRINSHLNPKSKNNPKTEMNVSLSVQNIMECIQTPVFLELVLEPCRFGLK